MSAARLHLAALRRVVGVLVTLLLLGSAVAYYRMSPGLTPTAVAAPSASDRTQSAPTPSVAATTLAPTPTASPTPAPRPTPSAAKGRPGVTAPGILLTTTVADDGTFEVTELVRLPERAATLAVAPPNLRDIGRGFGRVRPVISGVSAGADGHRVSVPGQVRGRINLVASGPMTRWELHYRLSGVVVRSSPSRAGRALAALRPLSAGLPPELPVALVVTGRPAINMICPKLPLADQICYVGVPSDLRVNRHLAFRDATVLVQLNLSTSR